MCVVYEINVEIILLKKQLFVYVKGVFSPLKYSIVNFCYCWSLPLRLSLSIIAGFLYEMTGRPCMANVCLFMWSTMAVAFLNAVTPFSLPRRNTPSKKSKSNYQQLVNDFYHTYQVRDRKTINFCQVTEPSYTISY